MIKSITNFPIIFFIFQELQSQISQIDQNGYNPFCDETLHYVGNVHNIVYHLLCLSCLWPKVSFPPIITNMTSIECDQFRVSIMSARDTKYILSSNQLEDFHYHEIHQKLLRNWFFKDFQSAETF